MDGEILKRLSWITPEEEAFLQGRTTIDRDLYMQEAPDVVNSKKLLASGKLITIRPNARFVHFPKHTHDYVELVYNCSGKTTHIVNGSTIDLMPGELLFLSQSVTHEVCRCEEGDVAVNFIILPDFFATTLSAIGEEETPLRRFLVDCLCGKNEDAGYLLFRVAHVKPVQNLVENLIWTVLQETPSKRNTSQMTMALLFLQLMGHTQSLTTDVRENDALLHVLRYVETCYTQGSLAELAEQLHYDVAWLSREIKRRTGKNYTQLVQDKRLAQAAFLLKNTDKNVSDISLTVGYENISYFHRLFTQVYGCSPKQFRQH